MSPLSRESGAVAGKPKTRKQLERIIMNEQHSMSSQCDQGIKGDQRKETRGCSTSFHTQWEGQMWKSHLFKKLLQNLARCQKRAINESEDGRKSPTVRNIKINLFCLEQDYQ